MVLVRRARLALCAAILFLCGFGALSSCTAVLGVDTDYEENPCSGKGLPPLTCGVGACTALTDACKNGLPATCTPGIADDVETCDGIDNNCDGIVDEGCTCMVGTPDKPLNQKCYTGSPVTRGIGECHDGTQTCTNSIWGQCGGDQLQLPKAEVCDKLDNNCDGKVDEGCSCAEGQEQSCYGGPGATRNVGPCKDGKQKCQGGKWGDCIGDIVPALEICNGSDDDCDGQPDNGCPCVEPEEMDCYDGPLNTKSVGACKVGKAKCVKGVYGPCQGEVLPKTESCDGVDNDCNGITDDGDFGGVELCDGKDNNCNGQVDEGNPGGGIDCDTGKPGPCGAGLTTCANGAIACKQKVLSIPESCDGVDNDCDGAIDNGNPGSGGPCIVPNMVGACKVGTEACQGGQLICKQTVTPTPESCNGKDDDCNGQTDEGNPGGGLPCNTGKLGACSAGITDCPKGALVCNQQVSPSPSELCDGIDNDCDGQTDEGNPGGGGPCTVPGALGQCASGLVQCLNSALSCKQTVSPVPESCNAKDDDCDGIVDNGNPGGGGTCPVQGQKGVCATGSLECLNGVLGCKQTATPSPETCDGQDNDCNGQVDEGNPGGGLGCTTGKPGVCANGTTACTGGIVVCNQNTQPSPETCDGKDNDCDGVVDNGNPGGGLGCTTGNPGVCGAGTSACQNGSIVCKQNVQPSAEQCDGLDNNCNGQADEGNPGGGGVCVTGQPGICSAGTFNCQNSALVCKANLSASPEVCDNIDNNCDGVIDNGNPGGGAACSTGKPGICSQGTTTCTAGMIVCQQNQQPSNEICDGVDNDCNSVVDNGNPGGGTPCVTGKLGICSVGVTLCQNGSLACIQSNQPAAETCDGQDNNCDGIIDNGNPGGGVSCTTGLPGICNAGTTSCQSGGLVCLANLNGTSEICDGLDNNCDGVIDNGNPGGGMGCSVPGKQGLCAAGSTACTGGAIVCQQVTSPVAETCDGKDNDCDGVIDNGNPGSGVNCSVSGKLGVCAQGQTICSSGSIACNQVNFASAETCDGKDNDCDGIIDNGNPGGGFSCTTGLPGICNAGTTKCQGGAVVCLSNLNGTAEICDGLDNNCDGQVDNGNPGGGVGCSVPGKQGLCAAGSTACTGGAIVCQQVTSPVAETCDGKDNDCDGVIDNGNPGGGVNCPVSGKLGVCAQGQTICSSGSIACNQVNFASAETCDGKDNDCDGVIDNGSPGAGFNCAVPGQQGVCAQGQTLCSSGALVCYQVNSASAEACDGKDNDCDGVIDNGSPGAGFNCAVPGQQGVCAQGQTLCSSGALVCYQVNSASAETCDGKDNNCNGQTDEGNPGGGVNCPTGLLGVCGAGTTACVAGALTCNQNVMPSAETCDGKDNNCNGTVDEGSLGGGVNCTVPGQQGVCAQGQTLCSSGALICSQVNLPAAMETCDGLDNNCDGQVDNGNPGGGVGCSVPGKQGLCAAGSTACTGGAIVCQQVTSPVAETCDGKDNDCDGVIDNGNPGSGLNCTVSGKLGVCAQGQTVCSSGALVCNQVNFASVETCDGKDNDCDGVIDNGSPGGGLNCAVPGQQGVCAQGQTLCYSGALVCNQVNFASVETCDGKDNDCDGVIDNGSPGAGFNCAVPGQQGVCAQGQTLCSSGALVCYQVNSASAETCDGKDNNCNGQTDEGNPGGGVNCPTGLMGICSTGKTACMAGAIACNPPSSPEMCDGLDNNCDGTVDESDPGGGGSCSTGFPGVCGPGTNHCVSGMLVCQQNVMPSGELCDNIDQNCDGRGTVFFSDKFSTPAAWATVGAWAFGVAAGGCSDPTDDFTPTNNDHMLAGAGIGACIADNDVGSLTSPVIMIPAGAQVYLQFERWLVTNAALVSTIEVYDNVSGAWSSVYTSPAAGVVDASWQRIVYDLKPQIAPTAVWIQIRWSYTNGNSNNTQGGWSIDDVVVTDDAPCN